MAAFQGRYAQVPRVPTFEANDRLKFTASEQQAIRAAELAFGRRPQALPAVQHSSRHRGLGGLIAHGLALLLIRTLVAAFAEISAPTEQT